MPALLVLGPRCEEPLARGGARRRGVPGPAYKFALRVAPSAIDGLGVFATEPIPPGRKIGEIRGEAIEAAEARRRAGGRERLMLIALSERRVLDASRSDDALRHANHSCTPSAVLRLRQGRLEVHSVRAIAPGDEITVAYGPTHHGGRLACRCGAARCAGWL
jgi:SET domain-containing protein